MAFPVRAVVEPAALRGQVNGRLDASILRETPGQAGGPGVLLLEPATRAWRALTAAAKQAGHILKISGPLSAYRPYADQERIFRERFTLTPVSSTSRRWNGQTWYLRPGYALAAVPGTSNHGRGLAVDVGEERDGDQGTESIDQGTLGWLLANADRYGWSWEVQSEPWHIRYVTGDHIPAAVLDWENRNRPAPPPPEPEDDDLRYLVKKKDDPRWWITDGICKRHVNERVEASVLVGSKLAVADDGGVPFVWPAEVVDDLYEVRDDT